MSGPAIYNPLIKQGAAFSLRISLEDVNGDPISLTGATYAGDILTADRSTVAASFTFTDDGSEVTCALDAATTLTLPGTGCLPALPYDIYITPSGADRRCPLSGLIAVEAANTDLTETPT